MQGKEVGSRRSNRVAVHRNSLEDHPAANAGGLAASALAETQVDERSCNPKRPKDSNRSTVGFRRIWTLCTRQTNRTHHRGGIRPAICQWEIRTRTTRAPTQGSRSDDVTDTCTGRYRTPQTRRECGETVQNAACARKRRLLKFVVSNSSWKDGKLTVQYRQPFDYLALGGNNEKGPNSERLEKGQNECWLLR